jgi:prefoldin subunit 5
MQYTSVKIQVGEKELELRLQSAIQTLRSRENYIEENQSSGNVDREDIEDLRAAEAEYEAARAAMENFQKQQNESRVLLFASRVRSEVR